MSDLRDWVRQAITEVTDDAGGFTSNAAMTKLVKRVKLGCGHLTEEAEDLLWSGANKEVTAKENSPPKRIEKYPGQYTFDEFYPDFNDWLWVPLALQEGDDPLRKPPVLCTYIEFVSLVTLCERKAKETMARTKEARRLILDKHPEWKSHHSLVLMEVLRPTFRDGPPAAPDAK